MQTTTKGRPLGSLANRASQWLDIALLLAVIIQIFLYTNRTAAPNHFDHELAVVELLYLTSIVLLIGVVCSRYIYHSRLTRQAEAARAQLDAMIDMFTGVKHKLNNDMQVVLGNAELAEILVNAGGNVFKPVQNITAAANHAVERIEQLSVFGSTGYPNLTLIDLNAMFRQTMAKLAEELPSNVSLRLELEHLSSRVVVDRCLISLSLSHLIRVAVGTMMYGGDIIIRTSDCRERVNGAADSVMAQVYIARSVRPSDMPDDVTFAAADDVAEFSMCDDIEKCQIGLNTIKALVERSGVINVQVNCAGDESRLVMRFDTDMQLDSVQEDSLESHLQSL